MKNSDSDYKAEDQGSSANEGKTRRQSKRNIRLNKKEMIQTAIRTVLPEGTATKKMQPLSSQQYEQLLSLKDADEFSLNYKTFLGKVTKVTDGDTLKAVVWLNNAPTKFTFRLSGIDAPETRRGEAKEFGKKVKQILASMIDDKMVKIEAGISEKYGRILARVYTYCEGKALCINDFLLEHDMARSYEGRAKMEFNSEDEEQFLSCYEQISVPKTSHFPMQAL